MKPDQILEALSKLDPANNDHWTQDGSPRLGAVGEGVTRKDIIDVAPLFNRKSVELSEPQEAPTEEEILAEVQSAAQEFKARKDAAQQEYKDALLAKKTAEDRIEAAKKLVSKLADEEQAKDPRTPTQINMDYLKSEHQQRMQRFQQHNAVIQHLQSSGLPTFNVSSSPISPADRAIAERNIRARRERSRQSVK